MAGKRFADFAKRCPIPENVAEFATQMAISHISTNLSFYGISSDCNIVKYRNVGKYGRV